ncbi:MAG: hypothetical protein ACLSAF_05490 [Intestinimonas sp.]
MPWPRRSWENATPCGIGRDETLSRLIGDNPAGQVRQLTPFILIREVPQEEAAELEARAQAEIAARGEGGALIVSPRSFWARRGLRPVRAFSCADIFPLTRRELRYILNIPTVCGIKEGPLWPATNTRRRR